MRPEKLEVLVTTGKLEGKKAAGRPKEKICEGLAGWLRTERVGDVLVATRDRFVLRAVIANAMWHST